MFNFQFNSVGDPSISPQIPFCPLQKAISSYKHELFFAPRTISYLNNESVGLGAPYLFILPICFWAQFPCLRHPVVFRPGALAWERVIQFGDFDCYCDLSRSTLAFCWSPCLPAVRYLASVYKTSAATSNTNIFFLLPTHTRHT